MTAVRVQDRDGQPIRERTLRVADRADCCGAQAFVRVEVEDTELLFCGHHFAKHELVIIAAGYEVTDERWAINDKPSPSAIKDER